MKALQFLLRAGVSVLIAFIASFSSAMIFFNYSNYQRNLDRVFLVALPTLAVAFLLFEAFPIFLSWLRKTQIRVVLIFIILALLGALTLVLPFAVSPMYYVSLVPVAVILFILMMPLAGSIERMQSFHSMGHYVLGCLLSLIFCYGAVGFLSTVLKTTFHMIVFTVIVMILGSVIGYYLVRRAAHSFREGFLSKPLNIILVLTLPVFLGALIFISIQFPEMFTWSYISVPGRWLGFFLASAVVAGVWGVGALEQFERYGWHQRFSETGLVSLLNGNLPGLYAGGMFFLINLVIARALNHPALSINTVLFETDAGPWMTILSSPQSDAINRSVHPLVLIISRPLIRFVALFMGDQWQLAGILVVAILSGLCVFMAWLFVKRATGAGIYALLFAVLLGSTATHLFFGSLTENYAFGMTALILFFLLLQANEKRFSVLVPAGLLVFGITISNLAQAAIGLFFNKFGFWRVTRFCLYVVAAGIALTVFTSALYPNKETFFFVPADIAFEANFTKPPNNAQPLSLFERFQYVSRTMFLYGVVGPRPIEDISHKPPAPTIDLKTFNARDRAYASYTGLANLPLGLWLLLLAGSAILFLKGLRSSRHLPLMLGLLGSLAFNFLLHMNYGTELFLYTPYWIYALIFFLALDFAELAGRSWFESFLTIFLLTLMANNLLFIFHVLRGLDPFFIAS